MNKTFKIIWSSLRHQYVVSDESHRSFGKKSAVTLASVGLLLGASVAMAEVSVEDVSGGTIVQTEDANYVYGKQSVSTNKKIANVKDTDLTIEEGVTISGDVVAGYATRAGSADYHSGTALNNTLHIKGKVTDRSRAVAGQSQYGNVIGNTVYLYEGGDVQWQLYGGYQENVKPTHPIDTESVVKNNTVVIQGGQANIVAGGGTYLDWGARETRVFGNQVKISGGTLAGEGSLPLFLVPEDVKMGAVGAFASGSALVYDNHVTVTGGTISKSIAGAVLEPREEPSNAQLNQNTVTVSGGDINGDLYGALGMLENNDEIGIIANQNKVHLTTGMTGNVYGVYVSSWSNAKNILLEGNEVNIDTTSTIGGEVVGTRVDRETVGEVLPLISLKTSAGGCRDFCV